MAATRQAAMTAHKPLIAGVYRTGQGAAKRVCVMSRPLNSRVPSASLFSVNFSSFLSIKVL